MAQQTLVLCTPDAVSRGVTFEISSQFEKRGLTMVACRMLRATTAQAQAHVDCTKAGSVAQLTSGPAVATVWQGAGAIAAGIEIAGAAGGSDLLSVSPSAASATLEIAVWFGADEVPPPDSNGAAAAASGSVAASAPSADGDAAAAGGKSKGQLKKEAAKAAKAAKKAEAKGGTPAGPAISTEPPSGTRDFFPAEMRTRNWLFAKFRETARPAPLCSSLLLSAPLCSSLLLSAPLCSSLRLCSPSSTLTSHPPRTLPTPSPHPPHTLPTPSPQARQLAFVEYDAPVLEAEQLYVRKGGEEITQQMYNFTDKDGKAVSLRPEMTPTLARMILSLGGKAREIRRDPPRSVQIRRDPPRDPPRSAEIQIRRDHVSSRPAARPSCLSRGPSPPGPSPSRPLPLPASPLWICPLPSSPPQVLLPVKWFSIPQCWRFETVQRGRKREHFQWNMDIVGEASIAAEARAARRRHLPRWFALGLGLGLGLGLARDGPRWPEMARDGPRWPEMARDPPRVGRAAGRRHVILQERRRHLRRRRHQGQLAQGAPRAAERSREEPRGAERSREEPRGAER